MFLWLRILISMHPNESNYACARKFLRSQSDTYSMTLVVGFYDLRWRIILLQFHMLAHTCFYAEKMNVIYFWTTFRPHVIGRVNRSLATFHPRALYDTYMIQASYIWLLTQFICSWGRKPGFKFWIECSMLRSICFYAQKSNYSMFVLTALYAYSLVYMIVDGLNIFRKK